LKRAHHFARAIARVALGLILCAFAGAASAHPHVSFTYVIDPQLDAGRITGLRVDWIMDPIASFFVLRSVDRNQDGVFAPDELAAFARGNQALLAGNRYFLTLTRAGAPVEFALPSTLEARFADQRMVLSFEVRLREPLPADSAPIGVKFFDRTWYVALQAHDPVLAGGTPCGSREQVATLATEGWGEQSVQEVEITCDARSVGAARVVLLPEVNPEETRR
jgi:ABC-type uncharacterized transport system substrate-binding protein